MSETFLNMMLNNQLRSIINMILVHALQTVWFEGLKDFVELNTNLDS